MVERTANDILAVWRDLERQQAAADPEGDYYERLEIEIARLRSEYHRVTSAAVAKGDQLKAASRESARRLWRSAELSETSRHALRRDDDGWRRRAG
jgi:hypothetical protein